MFSFFILSRQLFLSPRKIVFFHCYHCQQWYFTSNLSIYLSPKSVTTSSDRCYYWQFNPKPSYFHHLEDGRVADIHEEAYPNENAKRTTIHHQSLVPMGRLKRGSAPQMLRYIYASPPNRPRWGILNRSGNTKQILPLTGDSVALECAPMPE